MEDQSQGFQEVAEEEGGSVGGGIFLSEREQMDAPAARQGEEEPFGDDFCEGVGDGFLSVLFDGHAGGESADFEGGGTGELVGGGGGHGLDHGFLELGR